MNIKNITIIAAIIAVVISIVAFMFFRALVNENVSAPVMPSSPVMVKEEPAAAYVIPATPMPDIAQIEDSMKKNQEQSKQVEQAIVKMNTENNQTRQLIRAEAESADLDAQAQAKNPGLETRAATKEVKFSTQEQKQQKGQLKARGLVAF